ncbi:MAG: histidine kinase [Lentisphaerales bacterium]|nr:histidine kinase [Lentisphaerales bacterium]
MKITQFIFISTLMLMCCLTSAEDLNQKISDIQVRLTKLPKASLHESGAPMGFKSEWLHYDKAKRYLTIDLGEAFAVDQIVIVPALEPAPDGNKAHCFPKKLKVSVSQNDDSHFKEIKEIIRDESNIDSSLPILIDLDEEQVRYLKIDLLELLVQHYYALGEVFVFSNGRNVALNKSISTDCEKNKEGPECLVDGLSSLGMPILTHRAQESQSLWIGSLLTQQKSLSFDFVFKNERRLDEIRLYSSWLPNHSRPDNLPGKIRFYSFNKKLNSWEKFYEKKRSSVITIGDNPLAIQFPEVRSQKFRVEFLAVYNQKNDCNMSEIELVDWHKSITQDAMVSSSIKKIKSINLDRISAMHDGKLRYGEIIPLQDWLNGIVKRNQLEVELALLNKRKYKSEAYFLSLYKSIAYIISALLLIALGVIVKSRYDSHLHQQKLRREIASDLHDEIGSNLACINLIGEYLNQDDIDPEELKENAREIMDITNETSAFMHDIVWMLDPNRKGPEEFKKHLAEITERLLRNIEFNIQFKNFEHIESWPIDLIRNFILFYKESLNNLQKYSKATSTYICMGFDSKIFFMDIEDNGSVPLKKAAPSLYSRADKLGWDFQIGHSDDNVNKLKLKIRSQKKNG